MGIVTRPKEIAPFQIDRGMSHSVAHAIAENQN